MAKRTPTNRRVKLLVGIIGRGDERAYAEAVNDCCTAIHFSGLGYGTAKSGHRKFFGLDEIEKRIVLSLIPDSSERTVLYSISERLRLYLPGKGVAFTVPLSGISGLVSHAILAGAEKGERSNESTKKEKKSVMHELVIAVVHQKYTDAAIDAAKEAGATGCTLLHTKSLENQAFEAALGTSLKQETDTLTFLTTTEYKTRIMEAVRDAAGLKTDGSAVILSLPVDQIVGIGRFSQDEE